MSTNLSPSPSTPDPAPLSVTYLSLLPIEVHQNQFKHAMRVPFQKGLHLSSLLPHVQKVLTQTKEAAVKLPSQILEKQADLHYLASVKSLQTMSCWIKYLLEVYQETLHLTELSPADLEEIRPLRELELE